MTEELTKRAAELAEEIARTDILDDITPAILEALNAAQAEGYREGAEKMREDASMSLHKSKDPSLAKTLCCSGHDCGCRGASIGEYLAETHIRALPITPPQPAPQAKDDEREMREAFEKWFRKSHPTDSLRRDYGNETAQKCWNEWRGCRNGG